MKKNNDIQEWLRLYDTSAIPENKINELISAGKKYMDSSEFNKNSLQNILLSQLHFLPFSFWISFRFSSISFISSSDSISSS